MSFWFHCHFCHFLLSFISILHAGINIYNPYMWQPVSTSISQRAMSQWNWAITNVLFRRCCLNVITFTIDRLDCFTIIKYIYILGKIIWIIWMPPIQQRCSYQSCICSTVTSVLREIIQCILYNMLYIRYPSQPVVFRTLMEQNHIYKYIETTYYGWVCELMFWILDSVRYDWFIERHEKVLAWHKHIISINGYEMGNLQMWLHTSSSLQLSANISYNIVMKHNIIIYNTVTNMWIHITICYIMNS